MCTITLDSALKMFNDDIVVVTSRWYGPSGEELPPTRDCEGERVCVSAVEQTTVGGSFYTSTVMFNTLRTTDSGNYNCTATVSISMFSDVTYGVRTISVVSKFYTISVSSL